jgi:hypothetical protein
MSGAAGAAGAAGVSGSSGASGSGTPSSSEDEPLSKEEERDQLTPPPVAVRHRRVSGRIVILVVVILLVIGGLGGWYYQRHHSSSSPRPVAPTQTQTVADEALARQVGIQAADLPGWTSVATLTGNAFASEASSSPAATAAFTKASSALAGCLKVPALDVTRAFGAPSRNRVATSSSPTYVSPAAGGTAANSVVDVMRAPAAERGDDKVFSNPALFATCYQSYATTMLPYAIPTSAAAADPFTSVTVAEATVASPPSSRVHTQGFVITRTRTGSPLVTTAVAIFGGRMQATLNLTSPAAFPTTTGSSLISVVEGRVAGNLPAIKSK